MRIETERPEPPRMIPRTTSVALLLAAMAVLMIFSAATAGPTQDEPVYIGSSVVQSRWHDTTYNGEHPPLAKLISGIPLRFAHVRVPDSLRAPGTSPRVRDKHRAQYSLAHLILFTSLNSPRHLLWLARLPMIVLTLLFALVVYGFAYDLFGFWPAILSLALVVFSASLLGYGRLANNDVPVSGFMMLALWMLYRAKAMGVRWLVPAGAAYGLALASKFTALFLVPFVFGLAAWAALNHQPRATRGRLLALGAAIGTVGLAVTVVWISYGVIDPSFRADTPPQASQVHGLERTFTSLLPLPDQYREGMLVQASFEQMNWHNFFRGKVRDGRSLLYLPFALFAKTALGTLALWVLGMLALHRHPRRNDVLLYVIGPSLFLFLLAMMEKREFGIRYVLWMPLALAIVAGAWLSQRPTRFRTLLAGALVLSTAVSAVIAFPWFIPYANVAVGGSGNEYRLFADADPGQEFIRLASWLRTHAGGEPEWLLYHGTAAPGSYGIVARDLTGADPATVHGFVALSASELDYSGNTYSWITKTRRPIADIGHAILVYHVQDLTAPS